MGKKTACWECTGIFWVRLYSNPGSYPGGEEIRCNKSENEKIKEEEFNPLTGKTDIFEYYPGGSKKLFGEKGNKYKLCSQVNKGDCGLFEQASEEEKAARKRGT